MSEELAKRWRSESRRLKEARNRYLDSLAAIHELADFAVVQLIELDRKVPTPIEVKIAGLSTDGADITGPTVKGFYEVFMTVVKRHNPGVKIGGENEAEIEGQVQSQAEGKVESEPQDEGQIEGESEAQEENQGNVAYIVDLLTEALQEYRSSLPEEANVNAKRDVVVVEKPRTRTDLLLASLLIAAVSDYEVLFSTIASFFFQMRPEALRAQDAKVAWSEIEAYESLEDIKSHFINERVTQLMWGGFDEWMKWLAGQLKIRFEDVSLDSEGTVEVFQRRHVIVHNGGLVSAQYLAKVPNSSTTLKVGAALSVDISYLDAALDKLTVLGVSLTYLVLCKLSLTDAQHEDIDNDALKLTYDLLGRKRWVVVEAISSIALPEMRHDYARCAVRVNSWIAQKRMNGTAAIAREVEQWDVSALQEIFALAKKLLLDDPSAVEYAANLQKSGKLDQQMIDEWPLLADVRDELNRRIATSEEPTPRDIAISDGGDRKEL